MSEFLCLVYFFPFFKNVTCLHLRIFNKVYLDQNFEVTYLYM